MKLNINNFSSLSKTWLFDLDGTLVKHNGYLNGEDVLLPGVKKFFKQNIAPDDYVLILTARSGEYKDLTERFLNISGIRYNKILYNIPHGERILFNDIKPRDNLKTAYSVNLKRDSGL